MSEIIFGDVKMTIGGVAVDISDVSLRANKPRRAPVGNFEGSFEMQVDAAEASALFEALRPRGYWLRRQLHTRRKLWRQIARAFGLAYAEARELCRNGTVEIVR